MVRKTCITVLMGIFGAGALLILSCGGGGGGDSQALSGTWVSECFPKNGSWAWEKYVFDGTGGMNGSLEEFGTDDCSDTAVVLTTVSGTYSTGSEVDCDSGFEGKCRELDMSPDGENTKYLLYSLFPGDPSQIYLSSNNSDPASRPDDVVIGERSRLRNVPCPGCTGEAITGLAVIEGELIGTTPPPAPPGYTLLPIDLNEGTYRNDVWLYYRLGRSDGLEGAPIGRVYTVHISEGEAPLSDSDIEVPVNLNGAGAVSNNLRLYYSKATAAPVVRCVVVANETGNHTEYGPPSAAGLYTITWVEELDPDNWTHSYSQPPNAQDLNEGDAGDWIFLGYGRE